MNYHPVVEKIKKMLEDRSFWFETFEHEPVTTSEEAAKVRTGYGLHQGAKALIIKAKKPGEDKKFVMVCLPGDKKFDQKKLKELFGMTDTRFADENEVSEITGGVKRGGVPPFGNLFGLDIYADTGIFENEKIIFNAGDRSYSIGILSENYKELVNPIVGDIAE